MEQNNGSAGKSRQRRDINLYYDPKTKTYRQASPRLIRRRKQMRRKRILMAASAAVLLMILTVVIVNGAQKKRVAAENEARIEAMAADTASEVPDVSQDPMGVVYAAEGEGKEPESTLSSNAAELEEEQGIAFSDPLYFYEGYKVHSTSSTGYMDESMEMYSENAVLIDLSDGCIVAGRNPDAIIYPASMTKVLTVLTAADLVKDLDDTFTVTQEITNYTYSHQCSQVGFAIGETVPVRDLFYGTVLPSGGDAAMSLAVYCCGSVDAFVEKMNEKVEELGLSSTAHFTNPIGIHDENNRCSLTDIAMIMKAAAENEFCREVLSAHVYTTTATEQHPDGIVISNWFLRRIEDKDTHGEVICAKTGFVNESGCCAVSYEISNDGNQYICVTSNTYSSWRCIYDHVAIYDRYVN